MRDPSEGLWLSSTVVRADGTPAAKAVVVVSDPSVDKEIAVVETDDQGRFRVAVPHPRVALTATSAGQMAYLPEVHTDRERPSIKLGADCVELHGRIEAIGHDTGGLIIQAARFSSQYGDVFGTMLSPGGDFRVCVPAAFYEFRFPEAIVARRNIYSAPRGQPVSFRVATKAAIEQTLPGSVELAPESMERFVAGLPAGVQVLGLGEANHGTREFSDERTRLAIELARQRSFRLVMIEAGYGETLRLDEYIQGANLDVRRAVELLGYWIWDTETFLECLERLRAYNASVPRERRIRLVGFDVQDTEGAIDYLTRRGGVLSSKDSARLAALVEGDGRRWKDLEETERWAIHSILERVAATRDAGGAFSRTNQAALAARSILLRIACLEATRANSGAVRDAGMARLVTEVLSLEPRARASLWAHVGHLAREAHISLPPAGQHLAVKLGSGYQVYALLAHAGQVRAWDREEKIGVIPHSLPPMPPHGLEATLFRSRRDASVSYWRFARMSGDAARWLDGIRYTAEFGSDYPGDKDVFTLRDLRSIDGAVLFDRVTPTVSTPTGERVAKPAAAVTTSP